jgi:predicted permease
LRETAARYADAVQDGDMARANDAIAGLPQDSVDAIKQAVLNATSDAITVSMLVLAAVALAGAIFAWVVIGRRRTPDHIEMTHAAAV